MAFLQIKIKFWDLDRIPAKYLIINLKTQTELWMLDFKLNFEIKIYFFY